MRDVAYETANGQRVDLSTGHYFVNAHDLRNFAWEYTVTNRPTGRGGRVRRFSRPAQEKSVTIGIRGNAETFPARMNALLAATEPDILALTPGRLWLEDQYLSCYLSVSSSLTLHSRRGFFAEKELAILTEDPFWCTETTQRFATGGNQGQALPGSKRFNLRWPYRFSTGYANQTLYNTHYAETPMILTIYGPVADPSIMIAGNLYEVHTTLLENERLIISQLTQTIIKVDGGGNTYNLFDSRNKESDIFKPAPAGNSQVQYTGDWGFDITLVIQRSEPLWK